MTLPGWGRRPGVLEWIDRVTRDAPRGGPTAGMTGAALAATVRARPASGPGPTVTDPVCSAVTCMVQVRAASARAVERVMDAQAPAGGDRRAALRVEARSPLLIGSLARLNEQG